MIMKIFTWDGMGYRHACMPQKKIREGKKKKPPKINNIERIEGYGNDIFEPRAECLCLCRYARGGRATHLLTLTRTRPHANKQTLIPKTSSHLSRSFLILSNTQTERFEKPKNLPSLKLNTPTTLIILSHARTQIKHRKKAQELASLFFLFISFSPFFEFFTFLLRFTLLAFVKMDRSSSSS